MKVSLIRRSAVNQIGSYTNTVREFTYYSVLSTGWESGSRNRVKNFPSLEKVYSYLNKLNQGGWLSDEDYLIAWHYAMQMESFECNCSDASLGGD